MRGVIEAIKELMGQRDVGDDGSLMHRRRYLHDAANQFYAWLFRWRFVGIPFTQMTLLATAGLCLVFSTD